MTYVNLKTEVEFGVITHAGTLAYTTNDLELARQRKDKVDPTWKIVKITTNFEEVE